MAWGLWREEISPFVPEFGMDVVVWREGKGGFGLG